MTKRLAAPARLRPDDQLLDHVQELVGFGRGRQVVTLFISGVDIAVAVAPPKGKAKEIGRGADVRAAISSSMVGKRVKAKGRGTVRTSAICRTYTKRPCERKACGKSFLPTGPRALYCSSRCRRLDKHVSLSSMNTASDVHGAPAAVAL